MNVELKDNLKDNLEVLKKAGWKTPPYGWTPPEQLHKYNPEEIIRVVEEGAVEFEWFKQLGSPSSQSGIWITGLKNEALGLSKNYK